MLRAVGRLVQQFVYLLCVWSFDLKNLTQPLGRKSFSDTCG